MHPIKYQHCKPRLQLLKVLIYHHLICGVVNFFRLNPYSPIRCFDNLGVGDHGLLQTPRRFGNLRAHRTVNRLTERIPYGLTSTLSRNVRASLSRGHGS
ncbi:protein of unknown function [Nocardia cyriacigeorgica GUH-2]|uniref:Uncharacterized protein n=1 Tax=Nocardia cyriacigeorgica (strain GUH-2) TaxID=1127134 RepID=H6RA95_NOCCG|nr:protein of unknown function [Nocardia cyriacigeorgica GUH-2]